MVDLEEFNIPSGNPMLALGRRKGSHDLGILLAGLVSIFGPTMFAVLYRLLLLCL